MTSLSRELRAAVQNQVSLNSAPPRPLIENLKLSRALTLDRNNELGNDGEDLSLTLGEEVEDTLHSEEAVRVLLLTDTLHEDRQVVMIVELLHLDLPLDFVWRAVLNLDRQISAIVEAAELGANDLASLDGAGPRSDG